MKDTQASTITETTSVAGHAAPKAKRAAKKSTKTAVSKKGAKPVAPKKAAKKETKSGAKKADGKTGGKAEHADTKKAIVLEMMRRKEGATTADIAKATDWQNHTIRGFISGTLTKKMGLGVESAKNNSGERTYRIAQ